MKRSRQSILATLKKSTAFTLALLIVAAMLPVSVFSDKIIVVPEEASDPIYYWNGNQRYPGGDKNHPLSNFLKKGQNSPIHIKQYQLAMLKSDWTGMAYCSDQVTPPRPVIDPNEDELSKEHQSLMYRRVPIESVITSGATDKDFFGVDPEEIRESAERLRNILVHSDLYLDLNNKDVVRELEVLSGTTDLKVDEVISATQLAVWTVVNKIEVQANRYATTNANVTKYLAFLLALPGMAADEIASLSVDQITKTLDTGAKTYTAEVAYSFVGKDDLSGEEVRSVEVINLKTSNGTTIDRDSQVAIDYESRVAIISGIPVGETLTFTLAATQTDVLSVYLYEPVAGRGATQTFVSVVKNDVDMKTEVEVSSPVGLTSITIAKQWRLNSETGSVLPNAVVGDQESVFRFTYEGDSGFAGRLVIPDVTLKGNAQYSTKDEYGDLFELDKLYQVAEIAVNGEELQEPMGRYFTVRRAADDSLEIVWTDQDGNWLLNSGDEPLTLQNSLRHVFDNIYDVDAKSLTVTKAVDSDVEGGLEKDDAFTFQISYRKPGQTSFSPYAGEVFNESRKTDGDGRFTLKAGETAVFEGLPVEWEVKVKEIETEEIGARYEIDPEPEKTITIDLDGNHILEFVNTYRTGSVEIEKNLVFPNGSALGWADIEELEFRVVVTNENAATTNQIVFDQTVSYLDGLKPEDPITLTVPVGTVTVSEVKVNGAELEGYFLETTVQVDGGSPVVGNTAEGVLTQGGKRVFTFTNAYSLGSLTIGKEVKVDPDGLTLEQIKQIDEKEFIFDLYLEEATVPLKTITLKDAETEEITGLEKGGYRLIERDAGVEGVKLTTVSMTGTTQGNSAIEFAIDGSNVGVVVEYTNTYARQLGDLIIHKSYDMDDYAPQDYQFTFEITGEGLTQTVTVTIADSEPEGTATSGKIALSPGTYTIRETTPERAFYTHGVQYWNGTSWVDDDSYEFEVEDSKTVEVKFDNTYVRKTGDVSFTKVVEGTDSRDAKFKVSIQDPTREGSGNIDVSKYQYTVTPQGGSPQNPQFLGKDGEITGIKHGDTVTIKGLPAGAKVTIAEIFNGNYYELSIEKVRGGADAEISVPSVTDTIVAGDILEYRFINKRGTNGRLTISKVVEVLSSADFPDGFQFKITGPVGWVLDTGAYDEKYNVTKVADYTYQLTLLYGNDQAYKQIELTGLPAGEYIVEELDADKDGYTRTTSYVVDDGEIKAGNGKTAKVEVKLPYLASSVDFTNKYTRIVGVVVVTKTTLYGDKDHEFSFSLQFEPGLTEQEKKEIKINLDDGKGDVSPDEEAWVKNGDRYSALKFKIVHFGSVTIINVPVNVKVTLVEEPHDEYEEPEISSSGSFQNGQIKFTVKNTRKVGHLLIEKKVEPLDIGDLFQFVVTFDKELPNGAMVEIIDANGKVVTKTEEDNDFVVWGDRKTVILWLKDGDKATIYNIPEGTKYKVEEKETQQVGGLDGYTINIPDGAEGTIETKQTSSVIFINTLLYDAELTVKKIVVNDEAVAGLSGEFTFTIKDGNGDAMPDLEYTLKEKNGTQSSNATDGNGRFLLKDGETAVFQNLPRGVYTIQETVITGSTYTQTVAVTGVGGVILQNPAKVDLSGFAGGDTKQELTFTNTFAYKRGKLEVAKVVSFDGDLPKDADAFNGPYSFVLRTGKIPLPVAASYDVYNEKGEKIGSGVTGADGKFELYHGQTAQFTGLRTGSYVVEEIEVPAALLEDYDVVITYSPTGGTGMVSDESTTIPKIVVTNSFARKMGKITIEKIVALQNGGTDIALSEELLAQTFVFDIYNDQDALVDTVELKVQDGATDGSRRRLTGTTKALPTGTYKVVERNEGKIEGYDRANTPFFRENVIVTDKNGGVVTVKFENTYTRKLGSLTVTKTVASGEGEALDLREWKFVFTLTGPDEYEETITLTHASPSGKFENIPAGTYTLTETGDPGLDDAYNRSTTIVVDAGTDGEKTGNRDSLTFFVDGDHAADVKNTYSTKKAVLTLQKRLNAAGWDNDEKGSFTFTLHQWDAGKSEFVLYDEIILNAGNGYKASKELPVGTYQIKEVTEGIYTPRGYSFAGETYQIGETGSGRFEELKNGGSFDIANAKDITIECVNNYEKHGATISVEKKMDGYSGGEEFAFRLTSDNGIENHEGIYTIHIYSPGEAEAEFGNMIKGRFTLKAGQRAEIRGLDPGVKYTVQELVDETVHYTLTGITGAKKPADGVGPWEPLTAGADLEEASFTAGMEQQLGLIEPALSFVFTNTRQTGGLEITKKVSGMLYDDRPFKVYVTFANGNAAVSPRSLIADFAMSVSSVSGYDADDDRITVYIKDGETVSIANIPAGLTADVTEDLGEEALFKVSYEFTNKVMRADEVNQCVITNTREMGEVHLGKYIINDDSYIDPSEEFTFRLTFETGSAKPWPTRDELGNHFVTSVQGAPVFPEIIISGTTLTLTLKIRNDETAQISNIPAGTKYRFEEILSGDQSARYSPWVSEYDGYVNPGEGVKDQPNVDFIGVDNYDLVKGSLVITKETALTGNYSVHPHSGEAFGFTLSLFEADASGEYRLKVERAKERAQADLDALKEQVGDGEDIKEGYLAALEALRQIVNEDGTLTEAALAEIDMIPCPDCSGDGVCAECNGAGVVAGDGESCGICDEGGHITQLCTVCQGDEEAMPDCEACDGTGAELIPCSHETECEACGGTGETPKPDPEDCDSCGGTGSIHDPVQIQQVIDRANETFYQNLFVKITSLEDIINKLKNNYYVEYDENYQILSSYREEGTQQPYVLNESDLEAYYRDRSDPQNVHNQALHLDEIAFERNKDGTYSFKLKHDQYLKISGLPYGVTYEVTEDIPGYHLADYDKTKVRQGNAHKKESYTAEGTMSDDVVLIKFINYFTAKGSLTVEKEWVDDEDSTPGAESVTIALYRNGEADPIDQVILNHDNNWRHTFGNLDLYHTYRAVETDIPAGYTVAYSSDQGVSLTYEEQSGGITVMNTQIPDDPKGSLTVKKEWADGTPGTESVTIRLYQEDKQIDSVELSNDSSWMHTFTGLDLEQTYRVEEDNVAGYRVSYSGDVKLTNEEPNGQITVTNTKDDPRESKGRLTVRKVWAGEQGAQSVTVVLYQDDVAIHTIELNAGNGWSHTFTDLDLNATYRVRETPVPEGYRVSYSSSGITLSDTNLQGTITVTNRPDTGTEPEPGTDPTDPTEEPTTVPTVPSDPTEAPDPSEDDNLTEIGDDDTPLGSYPDDPGDPGEERIPDEDVPLGVLPKTGITQTLTPFLLVGSTGGLVTVKVMQERRRKKDDDPKAL